MLWSKLCNMYQMKQPAKQQGRPEQRRRKKVQQQKQVEEQQRLLLEEQQQKDLEPELEQ